MYKGIFLIAIVLMLILLKPNNIDYEDTNNLMAQNRFPATYYEEREEEPESVANKQLDELNKEYSYIDSTAENSHWEAIVADGRGVFLLYNKKTGTTYIIEFLKGKWKKILVK